MALMLVAYTGGTLLALTPSGATFQFAPAFTDSLTVASTKPILGSYLVAEFALFPTL